MKEFKYDVLQLIHGVRERPCLWNKNLEIYKDRFERRKAWEEIFNILDDGYESLTAEEKRLIGEHVLNKWTNIRDTFVKSLRLKMGKPRRKYILHEHLQFLINTVNQEENNGDASSQYVEDPTHSFLKEEEASEEEIVPRKRSKRLERSEDSYAPSTSRNDSLVNTTKKRSKKKELPETDVTKTKDYEINNDINFIEVDEVSNVADHRLMNEDEAFFASLLPTVVKYNEDERLEFRIEVLGVMKRIKENRKWSVEDA